MIVNIPCVLKSSQRSVTTADLSILAERSEEGRVLAF